MGMNRLDHDDVVRRVREAIDAFGSAALPAELAAHLRDCSDCAETAARHRDLVDRLRSLPRATAPAALADRIFAASRSLETVTASSERRRFLRFVAVAAPLAAAAAVAVGVFLREDRPRRPEIVIVEVPLEEMQKNSPFSPSLVGEWIRKAQG